MKLFKKITNHEKVKSFISVFMVFFFMNNLIAFGSENKLDNLKNINNDNKFEEKFFHNSITFKEYDNLESQLKIFFGRDFVRSENIFYPDLYLIDVSDSLRDIYRSKLNEMSTNEIIYNINK
tara:strand:+ start:254 stop:619 length:366 start_codon:yes stop_codon:yes gene_type:complete